MASKRANKSSVWDHMDKVNNGKVQCRLCSKQLAYSGSSTTSLMHHLKSMHPSVSDIKADQSTAHRALSSFGFRTPRQCNDSRQEKITALLMKVIVGNMLPLSLVDSDDFRELFSFIEPNYKMPCR